MPPKASYVEHVAVRVKDIDWHIRFFEAVLGMPVRESTGPSGSPEKAWTIGGMQFNVDPDFTGPEGRLAHIGIVVNDLEDVLARARQWGARELPAGRNWLALPDGLELELLRAPSGAQAI